MGRKSNRRERRAHILGAFVRVLAEHGYAGATIAAVAAEAHVAPGLLHHHFDDKHDMLVSLLDELLARFRQRVADQEQAEGPLEAYVDAALALDDGADVRAAKCWVGVFAEAIRHPALFQRMRRVIDTEIGAVQTRSGGRLSAHEAGGVLAYIVGALVLGAFAPRKVAGFAAPTLRRMLPALLDTR
jgi:TetR/AcrR family transcriptional regulator, transcriptional repressor of bet genes